MHPQSLSPTSTATNIGAISPPHTSYVKHEVRHVTQDLPRGTQRAMMDAAKLAEMLGTPVNRLLTVRTSGMRATGEGGILRNHSRPADCIIDFLHRNSRWCDWRCIPLINIWVREYGSHHGEHFHLGYHMTSEHDLAFSKQLSNWLDEGVGEHNGKPETLFNSELRSWQIDHCVKAGTSGQNIAAYLGKAEPNEYVTGWGKVRRNSLKQRRRQVGGIGPIERTTKHHYRWSTSEAIGRTQRDRSQLYTQ